MGHPARVHVQAAEPMRAQWARAEVDLETLRDRLRQEGQYQHSRTVAEALALLKEHRPWRAIG